MQWRQGLASFFHLVIFSVFLAMTLFACALAKWPELRFRIANLLLNEPTHCHILTLAFVGFDVFFLLFAYLIHRGQSLGIRMGVHRLSVNTPLIRQTVEECFKRKFSGKVLLADLALSPGKTIEIGVVAEEEILPEIERELTLLFRGRFGYSKPFDLFLKIPKEPSDRAP